jgi:DNA-binding NtrC family response regulator
MTRKTRILIIDNEPRWIEFAQQDLVSFEIVVAHTDEEARAQLEQDQFDLVIASAGSIEILDLIAAHYSEKTVVVTTVRPSTQEALRAYRSGAVRYFSKSFGHQDLLNNVKDVLPKA